jgi:hypothetical protein
LSHGAKNDRAVGDKVFVNGRSAIHAGSAGKTLCFPDVNLCPPTPPAGPIPLPLPNLAQGADLQSGASSVLIEGNPMAKKSSFIGKSTGNEVAQSTGGGVVSAVVQGKAYFTSYSVDVTVEGEEAPRHLDMLTQNHAGQSPPNAAMGTYLAMMDPAVIPAASEERPKRQDDKPQDIEFFLDYVQNKPTSGADSVILVSDDGAYNQTMPLSATSPKGGLLSLKFPKVLPRKGYSLYWKVGDEQIALFEHVAFADILDHTPGAEKPAAAAPPPEPDPPDPDDPYEANRSKDPPPDHPDDWYDPGPWKRK